LLVNAKISEVTLPAFVPLFAGKYSDFTVEWYKVVGTTIFLTMMINVISPHIGAIVKIFTSGLSKCIDRGCTFDRRRTR
jgi:hypothetical protein